MRGLLSSFILLALLVPATAQQSAKEKQSEKEWIAHCVSQISEANKPRAQVYCRCMAESVDTSEKLRQTDLERSFPPLHRECFKKAGFGAPS